MNKENIYHYEECGLPNIYIKGGNAPEDDHGNLVYGVDNITGLHKVISFCIVMQETGMTGVQLRFLRTEMGYTQAELAQLIHKEAQTIGRWERGEVPIDSNAEANIRILAFEKLNFEGDIPTIERVMGMCIQSTSSEDFVIDGSDPENYRPLKEGIAA